MNFFTAVLFLATKSAPSLGDAPSSQRMAAESMMGPTSLSARGKPCLESCFADSGRQPI